MLARGWLVREAEGRYLVRISFPRDVRRRRYTAAPCSISISRSAPKSSALRQRRLVAAAGSCGSGVRVLSCREACVGPIGGTCGVMLQAPAARAAARRGVPVMRAAWAGADAAPTGAAEAAAQACSSGNRRAPHCGTHAFWERGQGSTKPGHCVAPKSQEMRATHTVPRAS